MNLSDVKFQLVQKRRASYFDALNLRNTRSGLVSTIWSTIRRQGQKKPSLFFVLWPDQEKFDFFWKKKSPANLSRKIFFYFVFVFYFSGSWFFLAKKRSVGLTDGESHPLECPSSCYIRTADSFPKLSGEKAGKAQLTAPSCFSWE